MVTVSPNRMGRSKSKMMPETKLAKYLLQAKTEADRHGGDQPLHAGPANADFMETEQRSGDEDQIPRDGRRRVSGTGIQR